MYLLNASCFYMLYQLLALNATFGSVVERQLKEMHPAMTKPDNFAEFAEEPELDINDSIVIQLCHAFFDALLLTQNELRY